MEAPFSWSEPFLDKYSNMGHCLFSKLLFMDLNQDRQSKVWIQWSLMEWKCLWWSDPGSEFSDRVRVNIGAGLGQGLANQKPYLGLCSQWEESGFLWSLASVSWCRAGMVELSLSGPLWGHLSFTQMSLAHSLVSVTLLGLHVASIMTKWHSVILTIIIWSSNTDEGFRRFENKTKKIAVLEADITKQPASQPRPMSSCK